ncbi:sensor histidine kinase, partial [Kineococcus rubinsiae]|uniref:sensor histidine kinase n=1 Tax=Kineococcus rubinsiae TaxID=2609562 RepID=UPI00143079A4
RSRAALSARRRRAGWALALLGPAVATAALSAAPAQDFSTDLMAFLVVVLAAALAGGLWPAVAAALLGTLAVNWFFTVPLHRLTVARPANAVALGVFLLVALAVSGTVDRAARRSDEARRSRAETEALSVLTRTVLLGDDPLAQALEHTRATFAVESVSLLERPAPDAPWMPVASVGPGPCAAPEEGDAAVVEDGTCLVLRGRLLAGDDRRVLEAFAAQVAALRQRQRLRAEAAQVRRLEEGDAVRGALLTAVSHDLRTPLATLKTAVDSLRAEDIALSDGDRAELLASVGDSADRLQALIDDLLDLTRIRSGVVEPRMVPVALDELVLLAVDDAVGPAGADAPAVAVEVADDLPLVRTDPGLLRRVVANLVQNALLHGAPPATGEGPAVEVRAGVVGGVLVGGGALVGGGEGREARVRLLVVDHGRGLAGAAKERAFTPFQRLGDRSGAGLGLGLAVARGLAEAVDGRLVAEDTLGGGLTMVLDLPAGDAPDADDLHDDDLHDDDPDGAAPAEAPA